MGKENNVDRTSRTHQAHDKREQPSLEKKMVSRQKGQNSAKSLRVKIPWKNVDTEPEKSKLYAE